MLVLAASTEVAHLLTLFLAQVEEQRTFELELIYQQESSLRRVAVVAMAYAEVPSVITAEQGVKSAQLALLVVIACLQGVVQIRLMAEVVQLGSGY